MTIAKSLRIAVQVVIALRFVIARANGYIINEGNALLPYAMVVIAEKAFKHVVLYVLVALSRRGLIKVKEHTIDKAKIVVLFTFLVVT